MKIEGFHLPESSFLSVEKDMEILVDRIYANERLKKYLIDTTPDPLAHPKLTDEENREIFKKHIKLVPKLYVDKEVLNYIVIQFDGFTETSNPEFRSNFLEFDIICHFDQWHLKDYKLRPYRIAAEIDSMVNDKHLTGLGKLQFLMGNQIILSDEFAGVCLKYHTVHGEEDNKFFPDPIEDAQFVKDFNEMIRSDR